MVPPGLDAWVPLGTTVTTGAWVYLPLNEPALHTTCVYIYVYVTCPKGSEAQGLVIKKYLAPS